MTTVSPVPRRIATPRWFDMRLLAGAGLVLASTAIGAKVVIAENHRDRVLVLTHSLQAGTRLSPSDVANALARLPSRSGNLYVTDMASIAGQQLSHAVESGQLLDRTMLTTPSPTTKLLVPLAADAAPSISVGDRIELWLSSAGCPATVVLPDVAVQGVRADDSSSLRAGGGGQDVVIDVSPDDAKRVVTALALAGVTVRAAELSGAASTPTDVDDIARCQHSSA